MRKLIFMLAITAVLVVPAFARKETGALEGTVVDQDGTPLRSCGCLIIVRVGYAGPSVVTRWELRTDKMGHFFFNRFPVGAYSVTVINRDGRILKQIPDVRVEAGRVQNIDSVLGVVTLASPLPGEKKPKQPLPPTQPDIVRGCVVVRNITFQRARLILLNSNLGVSGWIENNCGHDAYVSVAASFFGTNGDRISWDTADKLVRPQGAEFRIVPNRDNHPEVVYSSDGRVTDVTVRFQP
jgi:hypothetical protein